MSGVRLLALCGAFAAGVLAAEAARAPAPLVLLAALPACAAVLAWRRVVPMLLATAMVGAALAGLRLDALEHAALAAAGEVRAAAELAGEVMTDARVRGGVARMVVGVDAATVDGKPIRLRERVWLGVRPPPATLPEVGARVRLRARLAPVWLPDLDAAGRAGARRLVHRGIAARAYASPADLEVTGRSGHPLVRIADAGRAAMRRAARHVPDRLAGLFLGVTIGDVERMPVDVEVDFRRTGLSHLVAVSGANVAMVLAVVLAAAHALRLGRRARVATLAVAAVAFMAVTRFEPSVLRAGVMALVGLGGVAIGARGRATAVLGAAVLILLAHDPFLIHAPGFQLSVLATLGILAIAPRVARALGGGPLATAAAVTLGAQLAVAPVPLVHFHEMSILAPAANLLVAPAVAPATITGMLAGVAGAVWEPAAALARAAVPPLAWMQAVAGWLAQLPAASIATPSGLAGAALALAVAVAAIAVARGWRPYRLGPLALVLMLVATGGVWARALDTRPSLRGLVVEMIDVGQGEAILIRADDRAMLVDGGPDPATLVAALRARGIHRIDVLALTHPHEDHVAGLVPVAEAFPLGTVLDTAVQEELASYEAFVGALDARGIEPTLARAGLSLSLGRARVEVLWPPDELLVGTGSDTNNNSIVARVSYGADSVLLAGEVEEAAMQVLLADPRGLEADLLKVSHHGSARMLPAFYEATRARIALIPVGRNTYGHPAPETLIALRGMQVLRSDHHGDVAVALDGAGGAQVRETRPAPAGMSGV